MDKMKVLELAREAEILRQLSMEVPFVVDRLERFAAIIEREVRGDAEPVAWLVRNGVVDYQLVKRKEQAEHLVVELQKRHNLSGSLASFNAVPLYTHPTPAVVRQLVEAAKRAMNYAENVVMAEGVYFDHDDDLPFIESALAAAKETGI